MTELDMKSRMRFSAGLVIKLTYISLAFSALLGMFVPVSAESIVSTSQQKTELWKSTANSNVDVQAKTLNTSEGISNSSHSFEDASLMTLNDDLMRQLLNHNSLNSSFLNPDDSSFELSAKVTRDSLDSATQYEISLPLPNGSLIDLTLVEYSVLPVQLAAKYPDIKTYRVLANHKVFGGKVDISASGFHAMLQMLDGEIVFIDPIELSRSQYAIFHKSAQKAENHRQHSCGLNDFSSVNGNGSTDNQSLLSPVKFSSRDVAFTEITAARSQGNLKNYTIAVATTGEYSAKFGGSVGVTLAAITTSINRVNQVLERDLGIHLSLAEDNDLLINTDASSDPFTETKLLDLVFQNQEFIDNTIGNANYDLGHLFTSSGGGLAAIASTCNNGNKAKAASGITSPRGDSFDLDFVAHEIGHQLGATHTFNSLQGACSTETRTARTAFEPGSGSSIMSYAGYCGLDNIQSNTDAMYHIGSIKQIAQYTNSGIGSRCGVVTSSQNTPPETSAGRDYTIPARTPFELTGSASDEDGDSLLFAWEQLDAGDTSTEASDKGNNALFRVHSPNSSKARSFPPLENILNHQSAKGETLPSYKRKLTMSFVAQDSFNEAQSDEMTINVVRTGSRFALNYPRAHYTRGSTYPVYWNVANTDSAPVNCSTVNISLSLDGGQNFNHSVASNVLNNGETLITLPADIPTSAQGRFKIKCSDNIFFAISHRNFFVTQSDDSVSLEYPNEDKAEANLEDIALNASTNLSSSSINDTSNINFDSSNNSGGGTYGSITCSLLFLLLFIRKLLGRSQNNKFDSEARSLLQSL